MKKMIYFIKKKYNLLNLKQVNNDLLIKLLKINKLVNNLKYFDKPNYQILYNVSQVKVFSLKQL